MFELPANLFTKWFGPGKAIPLYTIIFGVLSIAMAFVKNFGASLAVRFLLGYVAFTLLSIFVTILNPLSAERLKQACCLVCPLYLLQGCDGPSFDDLLDRYCVLSWSMVH